MSGVRWLIDGMNVIGSRPDRWWNDPEAAMHKMAALLEEYSTRTRDEITVVFDSRPSRPVECESISVVIASRRGRNAADHEIEQMLADDPDPSEVTVVTSDKRLAESIKRLGARVVGAGEFRKRLDD